MPIKSTLKRALIAAFVLTAAPAAFAADGEPWLVSKSSGEVWVTSPGAAQVSLGREDALKPGDTIRTGPNGRVRLTRGEETMMIAPNSEVGLPSEAKDGMATTILQRAGSILLDVEKRNVQHFEVETPYLAAVVKGTQFSVTINGRSTKVEVSRGQVEVSDFRTGQIAQVMPGQAATSFAHGKAGLSLSGTGAFNPIEQGRPRASTIDQVPVPRGGLHAPREAKGSVIHALNADDGSSKPGASTSASHPSAATSVGTKSNVVRISTSIGEVNLNINKATHGLAHGGAQVVAGAGKSGVWNDARGNGNVNASASNGGSTTSDPSVAAAVAAAVGSPSGSAGTRGDGSIALNNAGGNGNGNGGGHGNGGNGNANANGGNGNGGGNGNAGGNGNGNGNAFGHSKK